ncbi:MAG: cupredoxin domain-containing protein [Nanoarchaeota archaeon]|nr:cupredoxin domain-containing protein [Nanoarchaeota archaeon]
MKKIFLVGLLALVLVVAGCAGGSSVTEVSGNLENGVRVVQMKAFQFGFDPNPVVVVKGDKVKLVVTSTDVTHGFSIAEFGVNVQLFPGRPSIIDFTADKSGTFIFYCSVPCGAGHRSMRGRLIVK